MSEEWRPVLCYEGMYAVSDLGRVRSLERKNRRGYAIHERILSPGGSGHPIVFLYRNGEQECHCVPHLVARAFIGPRPSGLEVCHNDGNPHNNCLSNLRYDTPKNNIADKRRHGTQQCGERVVGSKLTESQVRQISLKHQGGETQASICRQYGMAAPTISAIVRRTTWRHVS